MNKQSFFQSAFALSLVALVFGVLLKSPELLAAATITAGFSYALRDYFSLRPDSVNVITCYAAFSALWFGVGNLAGYVLDADMYPKFHSFDVPEFEFPAQVIATLGAIVPLIGFEIARRHMQSTERTILSRIGFDVSDRDLLRFCLTLLTVSVVAQLAGLQFAFLGTLGSIVQMGPVLFIFIICCRWQSPKPTTLPRWTLWMASGVAAYQIALGLLFSNMRNVLIWPVAAFFLPYILNKKLTPARFVAGVLLAICFSFAFQSIGEVRGRMFGNERLSYMLNRPAGESADGEQETALDQLGLTGLLARLSTFNQLTQVVRIVDEDGYLEGETIGYALFVFIPRVVWPEKPIIAPGQWFARRLGRGFSYEGGTFSNAINMTIPGELFLNYGWTVTVLGLGVLGLMYFLFWQALTFRDSDANPIALIFTYVLFNQAMFNGSHLGAVINLILWYLWLTALTWLLTLLFGRARFTKQISQHNGPDRVQHASS